MQIVDPSKPQPAFALLNLGFRPFFLLAGGFAVVGMLLWMGVYFRGWSLPAGLSGMVWHGHEMVFGYAMAVIAGFLLTATRNWTKIQTLQGGGLLLLASLWFVARIMPFSGVSSALVWMAVFDLLFMLGLLVAIAVPIIRTRQWSQAPILGKLVLMLVANALFYAGLLDLLAMKAEAMQWGLYLGFYLVISLIMMMGRRVIPFFIEKGVNEDVSLTNPQWLDRSSLVVFLVFMVVDVFWNNALLSSVLAAILFVLHSFRLVNWYASGMWQKPLLWVLYLGYSFIVLGFALKAVTLWLELSPWLAIHAFAAGGIGVITVGMMSRVSLGHTGRSVFQPPRLLRWVFGLLLLGAVVRVIFPLVLPMFYAWEILVAQLFWIAGFSLFMVIYTPMLFKPRVDGQAG